MKHKQTIPILLLILVFATTSAFAAPPIKKLQASKSPPPEVQEKQKEKMALKKEPPPRTKRLTTQELSRKTMKMASKGTPPEVQEKLKEKMTLKKESPPRANRLSVEALKEKLKNTPRGREKFEIIERYQRPMSFFDTVKNYSLALLNPFSVSEAHAGMYSWTLSAENSFSLTGANADFYGVIMWDGSFYRDYPSIFRHLNGYIVLSVNIPAEGWYMINIYAVYKGRLNLHHGSISSFPIESWDTTNAVSAYYDYLTVENLSPGWHYFYFKPESGYNNFRTINITVDSWN